MPESAVEFWISDEADEDLVVIGVSEPVDVYRDPSTMAEIMQLRYSGFWYQEISVEPLKKLDEYKDVASFSQMLDEEFSRLVDTYNGVIEEIMTDLYKGWIGEIDEESGENSLRALIESKLYSVYINSNARYMRIEDNSEATSPDESLEGTISGTYVTVENEIVYRFSYSYRGKKENFDTYRQQFLEILDSVTYAAPKSAEPATEGTTEEPAAPVFKDMEKHWAKAEVGRAVEAGLFSGVSEDTFSPDTAATRAQLVTALYRMAGSPETGTCDFTDVKETDWFAKAVAWAAEQGIVQGSDGKFNPYGALTREELAVMLQRFARSRGYAAAGTELVLDAYKDQDKVSSWAAEAMRWAVSQKLINGMTTDTLVPAGTTTRAQLAVILMRYLDAEPNFAPAPDAEIPAPAPAETETVADDAA